MFRKTMRSFDGEFRRKVRVGPCRRRRAARIARSPRQKLQGEVGQHQQTGGEEHHGPHLFGPHDRTSGLETVAAPVSVRRDVSSASLARARSIDAGVVSVQSLPVSSPVRTLPFSISSSCCWILASSRLHLAMNRSGADMVAPAFLPSQKNARRRASVPQRLSRGERTIDLPLEHPDGVGRCGSNLQSFANGSSPGGFPPINVYFFQCFELIFGRKRGFFS